MWRALWIFSVCLVSIAALHAGPVLSGPVINEFMPGPGSDWDGDFEPDSRDDEWVEIMNAGAAPIQLDGLYLLNGEARVPVFGFAGELGPGGFTCVYGSSALAWQSGNDAASIGLSLNNAGDMLWLVSVGAGDTVVIDSVEYTSSEVGSDVSIGRLPDGAADWVLFDHFTDKGGAGADPTPCASNASSPAPHILEMTRFPVYPAGGDSVLIAVAAGDADFIGQALLAFDINLEDGEELPMSLLSGAGDLGTWGFTILPCAVGDTVHYRVSLEDGTGAISRSPWLGYRVRQCSLLIKINEILADPPPDIEGDANRDGERDASDDEFIEILNCGAAPVDISGWVLRDDLKVRHEFEGGVIVSPGEFVTVFGGGTPTGFAGKVYTASTGSLGLANSGDDISLLDAGGGLADFHSYASEGGRDESMVRHPDCDDYWTLPSEFDYGVPFSPHEPNDPQSSVSSSTWGGIKALYR
ncbi:MAG: lamin tail domain-containing protein [bacterium]